MKVDILLLGKEFTYLMVGGHTVGSVALYLDGYKFSVESFVHNVFSPKNVEEIRRVGNDTAAAYNVTKRLTS